jgi:predicted Zn-dependent protease
MKVIAQFVSIAVLFFATWFTLGKVDWMHVLRIEERTNTTEKQLSDFVWKTYSQSETEIKATSANQSLKKLVFHLCRNNNIDTGKIKLHLLEKGDINAFTLPDGHIVVYTGLINSCDNESELMGVLGHEMAHMEKNHVMKKMVKEVGLSALVAISSGKGGGEAAQKIAKLISSSAYDRNLEKEADITAVDYLVNAGVDPAPLANFMYRLSDEGRNTPHQLAWISTHPDSKERANYIIEYAKGKHVHAKQVTSADEWDRFKKAVEELK